MYIGWKKLPYWVWALARAMKVRRAARRTRRDEGSSIGWVQVLLDDRWILEEVVG
jgi:hypothetical protein